MSEKIRTVRAYHRNVTVILGVILAIFLLIPAFVKNPYTLNVFILIFYTSTLSMAWNLLGGMTGQNSLGHAAYMGLGAYAASMLITKAHMNPWLSAILGIIIVGLVAGVIFYPCFILKGPYFTLVSIAFGEALRQFIINSSFFGRASGIGLPFGRDSWLNFRFGSKEPYYYVGLAMLLLVYLIMKLIYWDRFDAGQAPTVIIISTMCSILLAFMGFLGEYIAAINVRVMKRPLVVEEERINFDAPEEKPLDYTERLRSREKGLVLRESDTEQQGTEGVQRRQ